MSLWTLYSICTGTLATGGRHGGEASTYADDEDSHNDGKRAHAQGALSAREAAALGKRALFDW